MTIRRYNKCKEKQPNSNLFHTAIILSSKKKGHILELTNNPLWDDQDELKHFTLYFWTFPEKNKPVISLIKWVSLKMRLYSQVII